MAAFPDEISNQLVELQNIKQEILEQRRLQQEELSDLWVYYNKFQTEYIEKVVFCDIKYINNFLLDGCIG